METKTIYGKHYTLNMVKITKFKTNRIQLSFGNHLFENTISKRSLVPYLLKAVSKKYHSREIMSAYIENMYAAHFNVGVSKIAKSHFINFDLSIINDQYTLNNEHLFDKALSFLKEILFNPFFNEKTFEEEKRLLKEYFKGIYSNKLKYAIKEMYEIMFKDEVYRINALGIEKKLDNIQLNDCINAYNEMMKNDLITISVIGDINFDEVENKITKHFPFKEREFTPILIDTSTKQLTEVTEVTHKIDITQAKLVLGYRLNIYYQTDLYYAGIIFNTLFGGSSESMLFKEIRDHQGLVYFINSSYDPYKGVLFIVSGINKKDYNIVNKTIDNIVTKIINKEYSDNDLKIAKTILINALIESLDSNQGIITRITRDSLFHNSFNPSKLINKINSVTKDDVSSVAKILRKDTIFLLRDELDD